MPRLKQLSGKDVITILHSLGFSTVSQRGSHAKLRRVLLSGAKQTLTIPIHDEIDTGTLRAIVRQASRYISDEELNEHFYG